MNSKNDIFNVIYSAIDEYNSTVPEEDRIEKRPDAVLFDNSGKLDSMGYIALSVAVEAKIQGDLGATITLFAQYPDYPGKDPLKTVSSLVDYAAWLVSKAQGGA